MTLEEIARICHETNRVLSPGPSWQECPQRMRDDTIGSIILLKDRPDLTAEKLHQWWRDDKKANDWKYGPEKDEKLKTHPCLIGEGFHDLSESDQAKDYLRIGVAKALLPLLED